MYTHKDHGVQISLDCMISFLTFPHRLPRVIEKLCCHTHDATSVRFEPVIITPSNLRNLF